MIQGMVENLKKEQVGDDSHVAYCRSSIDREEDNQKSSTRALSEAEETILESKEDLNAAADQIKALSDGLNELDKSVAEAMEQRKAENGVFVQETQDNKRAKELLSVAKNRLQQFYNPKLARPQPALLQSQFSRTDQTYNAFTFLELSEGAPLET